MDYTPFCIWLTGLSGAGKTTLAKAIKKKLNELCIPMVLIDGDDVRRGLNHGLGFSTKDRTENIQRVTEICKIINASDISAICAFISPTNELRQKAREAIGTNNFIEIFVNTPIEECIRRDPKKLYRKALNGEINNFTGINGPYEPPLNANLTLKTIDTHINENVNVVIKYLKLNEFVG